jgi:SagB-type dehydrogenase family enzyme
LYPIDLWVLPLRVAAVPRAVFRFDPHGSRLERRGDEQRLESVLAAFAVSDDMIAVSRATAVVLLVARPWRAMRKYGPRGMRFVFMEAGAVAQNLELGCTSLGLGAVDCASIYDDEVNEALGFDGVFHTLVHAVVLGHPGE